MTARSLLTAEEKTALNSQAFLYGNLIFFFFWHSFQNNRCFTLKAAASISSKLHVEVTSQPSLHLENLKNSPPSSHFPEQHKAPIVFTRPNDVC